MKKLITIILICLLGFVLISCGDDDEPSVTRNTQVENTSLVDDLVGEIKGVFEKD